MLSCDNVQVAVPGRVLCSGLSLAIESGQFWTVLGPNGAGKTSLLHVVAGLAQPTAGTVTLAGVSLHGVRPLLRARKLGVLLQTEESLFWGTVRDYVLLGRYAYTAARYAWNAEDENAADRALDDVGMHAFAGRSYATLSGGERQRVRLAQVLAQAPDILLLDEPLQHLDVRQQARVMELLAARVRDGRQAVFAVIHDVVWAAQACTHAVLLHADGVAEAGPAAELVRRERLEKLYGCRLEEVATAAGRRFIPVV